MESNQELSGIFGILVTPFDRDDNIAPERLGVIIDRLLVAGVDIPVVNGNTGEFYALNDDEAAVMIQEVVAMVNGRAPVLAGVGGELRRACLLARQAAKAGVAGLMVHQPTFPFVALRGIVDYVQRVSDSGGGLPVLLYLRDDSMGIDGIEKLCSLPSVRGVKWASTNPMNLAKAIAVCQQLPIIWIGGLAEPWAPIFYSVGARGFTSGLVNVWPERSVAIYRALESGDYPTARSLISGISVFEEIRSEESGGTNVAGVKTALREMGIDCGPTRAPSAWPLTESQHQRLKTFLSDNALVRAERLDRV